MKIKRVYTENGFVGLELCQGMNVIEISISDNQDNTTDLTNWFNLSEAINKAIDSTKEDLQRDTQLFEAYFDRTTLKK